MPPVRLSKPFVFWGGHCHPPWALFCPYGPPGAFLGAVSRATPFPWPFQDTDLSWMDSSFF
jgi:hypothetical protein